MRKVLEAPAQDLKERGDLDLSECFIDATFIVAKKGDSKWERPSGDVRIELQLRVPNDGSRLWD